MVLFDIKQNLRKLAFRGKLPELTNNVTKFTNHYTSHYKLMIMHKKKIIAVDTAHYICILNETLKVDLNKLSVLFSFMI